METVLQDLRYALRGLRRSPGFTLVALLTLALGIGVNSAIFGVVNAILYRPLPVEQPGQLVDIYGHPATSATHETHSYPNFLDYRRQATTLSGLVGYTNFFAHATLGGHAALVVGELVSEGYFETLGVRPVIGRTFTADEQVDGASPAAVLSHNTWRTSFGRDPAILGRQFRMNGIVYTVVGVAPESFGGMVPAVTAQMWVPVVHAERVEPLGNQRSSGPYVGATRLEQRARHWLWLRGRMKPGVDAAQVRAELEGIAARLSAEHPASNALERIAVVATRDVRLNPDADSTIRPVGLVLIGAVSLVLIVACANLANLMLARAAGRRRELSLRIALGAGRNRLLRQLLTESIVLALAGGLVAVPITAWLASVISRVQPPLPIDIGLRFAPDWRVLLFTLGTAVATGILVGLLPALRASNPALAQSIRDGGEWMDGGRRKRIELRDALVVMQVAVSLVLVVAGALLVRSVGAAGEVRLGYDGERLAIVALPMEMNGYDTTRSARVIEQARQRLLAMPSVESVALTSRIPLSLNNNGFSVFIDGHQRAASDRPYSIDGAYVDDRYATTLGLRLIAGRFLDEGDRYEARRVVVITKTMADRYWPGGDAIGREIRTRWGGDPWRIVGVVADYKVNSPGETPKSYIHLPLQRSVTFVNFIVRTRTAAAPLVPSIVGEFHAIDPDMVFLETGTVRGLADVRVFPVRAGAWLIGTFGMLALAVAAIGLYGVIGYSVSRRVREIGVRKALGAESQQIVRMVLGEGMTLVLIGGAIGLGLAALASNALSAVLFVGRFDPASFLAAFAVLAAVAAAANGVPAWRASRVDAMIALKHE